MLYNGKLFKLINTHNINIFVKWAYFSKKKSLGPNDEYPFCPKWPLKMSRGFEARAVHPVQTKSEYTWGSAPWTPARAAAP